MRGQGSQVYRTFLSPAGRTCYSTCHSRIAYHGKIADRKLSRNWLDFTMRRAEHPETKCLQWHYLRRSTCLGRLIAVLRAQLDLSMDRTRSRRQGFCQCALIANGRGPRQPVTRWFAPSAPVLRGEGRGEGPLCERHWPVKSPCRCFAACTEARAHRKTHDMFRGNCGF